ncbi:hypothetical protein GCM10012286_64520 [Streptomyces lasiicapitis]|uniref:Uncharacterized protein n=1 Tax=Streptomyces lasiicapitis TaxID=1923961 RepID=A0ABQ2MMS6_9ACTN|nr:hypothetical protein GCM10012286_64520 [Streptomyces lasiicapitis]
MVVGDVQRADLPGRGLEVVQGDGRIAGLPGDEEDAARACGDPGGAVDLVQAGALTDTLRDCVVRASRCRAAESLRR